MFNQAFTYFDVNLVLKGNFLFFNSYTFWHIVKISDGTNILNNSITLKTKILIATAIMFKGEVRMKQKFHKEITKKK